MSDRQFLPRQKQNFLSFCKLIKQTSIKQGIFVDELFQIANTPKRSEKINNNEDAIAQTTLGKCQQINKRNKLQDYITVRCSQCEKCKNRKDEHSVFLHHNCSAKM